MLKITTDHDRFRKIVQGQIKKNLQKYIVHDAFLGREGSETVKIPVPRIDIPRCTYGQNDLGGIGQGEGEEGDIFDPSGSGEGEGGGLEPGEHIMEIDMSIDEITDMLIQELELPYLEPKGENIFHERQTKATVRKYGVRKDTRRTLRNALKRQIGLGTYNPDKPVIIPVKEDFRYLVSETEKEKELGAVLFYLLDISGSMGDEQKHICHITNKWLERIVKRKYPRVQKHYVVHDTQAKEVKEKEFYGLTSGGGTRLSAPYETALEIITKEYPSESWNIYIFHYSDGDNQSGDDDQKCRALLAKELLPIINVFGYGQCKLSGMSMGSPVEGRYLPYLYQQFHLNSNYERLKDKVRLSKLYEDEMVLGTIKEFLRK